MVSLRKRVRIQFLILVTDAREKQTEQDKVKSISYRIFRLEKEKGETTAYSTHCLMVIMMIGIDFDSINKIERYQLLCSAVVPRPIAFISTIDNMTGRIDPSVVLKSVPLIISF